MSQSYTNYFTYATFRIELNFANQVTRLIYFPICEI